MTTIALFHHENDEWVHLLAYERAQKAFPEKDKLEKYETLKWNSIFSKLNLRGPISSLYDILPTAYTTNIVISQC